LNEKRDTVSASAHNYVPARLLPLGDSALTLELGRSIETETHERVLGVAAALEALKGEPALAGVEEWVSSFCALTVHFDPDVTDAEALGHLLLALAARGTRASIAGLEWVLPACFDEEFAPDLDALAARKGMSPQAVIDTLLGATFRVYTIGFLPGFPYMGGLPEALQVPRLATPRTEVPARSIAVAGGMCAIYPFKSPGGWRLIGRTPLNLFDPAREAEPALLAAGDTVQWQRIDAARFAALEAEADAGTLDPQQFLGEGPHDHAS